MGVFVMFGVFLGYVVPYAYAHITNSKYNRSSMDIIMQELLGGWTFNDVLSHELVVVAYAYNEQEPRFFSKFFNYIAKGHYDVSVG